MSSPHGDQIIDGYLARLRTALGDLPGSRQQELVDDLRRHIAEARAGLSAETDAEILNILDRIGEPGDIAATARERLGMPTPQAISDRHPRDRSSSADSLPLADRSHPPLGIFGVEYS